MNVDAPHGQLHVEVLDEKGEVIAPYTKDNCISVSEDKTLQAVEWKGAEDLSSLAGKAVKFRFYLRNGKLYSFWVSPDKSSASYGYVAAGGPGFVSPTDSIGGDSK